MLRLLLFLSDLKSTIYYLQLRQLCTHICFSFFTINSQHMYPFSIFCLSVSLNCVLILPALSIFIYSLFSVYPFFRIVSFQFFICFIYYLSLVMLSISLCTVYLLINYLSLDQLSISWSTVYLLRYYISLDLLSISLSPYLLSISLSTIYLYIISISLCTIYYISLSTVLFIYCFTSHLLLYYPTI